MRINAIEIKNIKGISHHTFQLNLLPNKPNLLVAPNGFGKSSFGVGFDSLKKNKLYLDEKFLHNGDKNNKPYLALHVEDATGAKTLLADETQNSISPEFDVFVINSLLLAKATKFKIGGTVLAKSSLEIASVTLVPTIPPKVVFTYKPSEAKKAFGVNGKILPNLTNVLACASLLQEVKIGIDFSKFEQVKISNRIQQLKTEINSRSGTGDETKQWLQGEKAQAIAAIPELYKLSTILRKFNEIDSDADSYLAALQLIDVYLQMGANFNKAINYLLYQQDRNYFEQTIATFNTTRHQIKPKEDKKTNSLIVEFPTADEISNGQRDVLSFITLLLKAKKTFKKQHCLLVIDEIFDYLDDANLLSFQYFVTMLIEEMKAEGKKFYPLLMTHLDPLYFNHFCFSKHRLKVIYLKEVPFRSNPNLVNLIKKRADPLIQAGVDAHHFHFHPDEIDLTAEFSSLQLPPTWGESKRFHLMIRKDVFKYLNDENNYDPLAICFAVRVRIEQLVFRKINDPGKRAQFLATHGTSNKLDYAVEAGIEVPETYYLLGIIYNDRLHWRLGLDNVKPVAIKLENITIKNLIRELF